MLNDIYQGLDPIAFSLGPLVVRWYGLAYVLGFVCAAAIIYFVAKRWKLGMSEDNLLTLMVCAIVGVVLGARIGYVLFYGDGYYLSHPLEILAFNQGGMSFHGGLVGLLIGGAVAARMTRIPFLTLADLGSIAAPIGLFFGRCANFVNGELWGAPTDGPLGVVFGGAAGMMPRHPSQLYEAVLEGLVIFCVLFALSRKRPPRPQGTFLGAFLVLYGIFRFLIEFVRGAAGSPWAKCSRHRSSWPASRCSSMRRGRGIPRPDRRRFSRRLSLAMRLRRSIGFSCNDVVSPGVAEIGVALLPVQYFKAADSASAALCNEQLQEI